MSPLQASLRPAALPLPPVAALAQPSPPPPPPPSRRLCPQHLFQQARVQCAACALVERILDQGHLVSTRRQLARNLVEPRAQQLERLGGLLALLRVLCLLALHRALVGAAQRLDRRRALLEHRAQLNHRVRRQIREALQLGGKRLRAALQFLVQLLQPRAAHLARVRRLAVGWLGTLSRLSEV